MAVPDVTRAASESAGHDGYDRSVGQIMALQKLFARYNRFKLQLHLFLGWIAYVVNSVVVAVAVKRHFKREYTEYFSDIALYGFHTMLFPRPYFR